MEVALNGKTQVSSTVTRLYSVIGGSVGPRPGVRFSFLYGDVQQLVRAIDVEDLYEGLESDIDFLRCSGCHSGVHE